jgi:hypothetical protein
MAVSDLQKGPDNSLRAWGGRPATGAGEGLTPTAREALQKLDPVREQGEDHRRHTAPERRRHRRQLVRTEMTDAPAQRAGAIERRPLSLRSVAGSTRPIRWPRTVRGSLCSAMVRSSALRCTRSDRCCPDAAKHFSAASPGGAHGHDQGRRGPGGWAPSNPVSAPYRRNDE